MAELDPKKILGIIKKGRIVKLQEKTATPTTSSQTVNADEEFDGLRQVTVEAVTSDIDGNITAENIKEGVSILGVTGTYDPQPDFQEKTVTITENKTTEVIPDSGKALSKVNVVTNVEPILQEKTAIPTTSSQTIKANDGFDGLSQVTVTPIPPEYIIPTGTLNVTENGTKDVANYKNVSVNVPATPTQEKTVTITENKTTEVIPDADKVLSKVTVTTNVQPELQEKMAAPSITMQEITSDIGYDGLSKVTIEAVTNTIDSNITAENIKKDVTILGVTGTLEQGGAGAVLGTLNATSNGTYNAVNALSLEPGVLYEYKKVLPREVLAELKTKTSNTDLLFCVPSLDMPAVVVFIKEVGGEYVLEQVNGETAVSIYATGNTNISIGNTNLAVNSGWNSYINGDSAVSSVETSCIRLPKDLTNIDASFINLLNKPFDTINEIEMSIDTSGTVTIPDLGSYHKANSFPADATKQYLAPLSFMKYDEFSDLSTDEAYNNLINLLILRSTISSFKLQEDISGLKYLQMNSQTTGAVKFLIYVEDSSQVQVTSGEVETGYWYVSSDLSGIMQHVTWVQEKDFVDGYNKVIVDVAPTPTQEKTIEIISNKTTEVTPDTGKALSKVTITTNIQPELGTLNATSNGTYDVNNSSSLSLEPGGLYEYKKVLPKEVLAGLVNPSSNQAIFGIPTKEEPKVVGVMVKEQNGEYALMQVAGEGLISCYATADVTINLGQNYNFKAGWNVVFAGDSNPISYDTSQIRLPLDISYVPESFVNLLSKQFSTNDVMEMSIDTSKVVTISGLGTFCKVTSFPINPETKNLVVSSIMGYNEVSDFASADSSGQQAIISCAQIRQMMSGSNLRTDIAGIKYLSAPYFPNMGMGLGSIFLIYVEDASKIQVSSGSVETGCWYIAGPDSMAPMLNGSSWALEKKPLDGYNKVIVDVPGTPTQEKTIEITTNGTTEITPDVDKTLSKVTVTTDVQPVLQEKTVEIAQNGTTEVTPDSGKVLSKVTVTTNVQPELQEKTAVPETITKEIVADDGFYGLSKVTVEEVTSSIDGNITPENIKKDVTILGVTGLLEGGSISEVNYTVKVIDYDGTLLLEQQGKTGDVINLPTAPAHDELIFEEWSTSIPVKNNTITIENSDVIVGAIYKPASGKNEFDITLTKVTGLSVTLNMDGTKEWGDGTSDTATAHTYTKYGDYTIMCDGTIITSSSSSGLFGQSQSTKNYYCTKVRIANTTNISDYAFQYCYSLANIIIPSSVTSIGAYAFDYCRSLTNITIPSSVITIGGHTFDHCGSLTNITIPNGVTSIGDYVFREGDSLTCVIVPNSVTSIGNYAFNNCRSLTSITIPNSVTSIGNYAFSNCEILKNINIPRSITSISECAFSRCYLLTNIIIPNSITSIGNSAFSYCGALTNITIPNSVTIIGNSAFSNCGALTNITIPNSVTSIGASAFAYCDSLTSITIPNSVKSIRDGLFEYCQSLTNITIPNSVTSIGAEAFSYCRSLTSITIPNSVTSIGREAFHACSSLTNITIPNGVESILHRTFQDCYSLTSMTIPSSVRYIHEHAFSYCYSIIRYDFSQCTRVPNFEGVTVDTLPFQLINNICKIIVPDNLAAEWIAKGGWSTYADYIYKVSEINVVGDDGNIVADANGNILQDSNGNNIEFTQNVTPI